MKPIDVIFKYGTLLYPHDEAAVVGGNVLTSQRVVDVIFKAFKVCAASQVYYIKVIRNKIIIYFYI